MTYTQTSNHPYIPTFSALSLHQNITTQCGSDSLMRDLKTEGQQLIHHIAASPVIIPEPLAPSLVFHLRPLSS